MRRRVVAWVQIGLFVGLLGLPDGALGALWPSLRRTFHRPVGDLGILVLGGMVPYLAASAVAGRVVRRKGIGHFTIIIGTLAVASFVSWAVAPVWSIAVGSFAVLGWSRGSTDAALNAYASNTEGVRRLGLLHALYGVGATAGPLLVSVVLAMGGGWRLVVAALAALAGLVTIAAIAARGRWTQRFGPDTEPRSGRTDEVPAMRAGSRDSGGRGGVAATLGAFGAYTAAEAATGAWAFTVLTESRHLDRGVAGAAVASYWAALTAGRFVVASVGHRVRRGLVVSGGAAVALVGVLLFAAGGRIAGPTGLPVAGLGFAPVFPVMVSLIPDRVGGARSTAVIGWAIGVAAVGGPAGTAAVGVVASVAGLPAVGEALAVFAAVLVIAAVAMFGDAS